MNKISFMGSYSGIDRAAIDQMMEAEKIPLIGLSNKKINIKGQQDAWKDINTRLNSLFEKIKVLESAETYQSKKVTSTNENIVTMEAGNSAVPASYNIVVKSLASSTRVIGERLEDIKSPISIEDNFTITNHDGDIYTINLSAEDNLTDIASKINEGSNETGINATIIDNRLVLEDGKAGNREIKINGSNDTLNAVGLKGNLKTTTGSKALFEINGVEVEKDSNRVSGVIAGVTINLSNTHQDGESENLTIGRDTTKTQEAVKAFVDQYNSTMAFIEDKMAIGVPGLPGEKGHGRAELAGDSSLKRLQSSLRQMVTSPIANNNTEIKEMSELGVSTIDKFGVLQFNPDKLNEKLEENIDNVKNFFASRSPENNKIGFVNKVNSYIDSFISKSNGLIKGKADSFERSLKDIDRQIENFNMRVERKEQYYVRMFSALDVAMMQAESQMGWLSGQMSAMNAQKK